MCKKIENSKKKTKQSLSLLITRLSIACSAYPTVQVEKLRTKHNTQERTKLSHTAKKIKKNRCMSRNFAQNAIQRHKQSSQYTTKKIKKNMRQCTLFFIFIRMLFSRARLNILIFPPILGFKYSCIILNNSL